MPSKYLCMHHAMLIAPLKVSDSLSASVYVSMQRSVLHQQILMQGMYTYDMLRETAHSQGLETCAECAPQRTPRCIPLFHQPGHPELGSTVSHPFDKHLHTYIIIVQHFKSNLGYYLHDQAIRS